MRELASAAEHASFLAKYFDLPPNTTVVAHELHDQLSQLTVMRGVLDRMSGKIAIGVQIACDATVVGKRAAIVVPLSTRIGDHILAAVILHGGLGLWNDDEKRLTVEDGEIRLLGKWVVPFLQWREFGFAAKARQLADDLSNSSEYDFVAGSGDLED
jgi:hypothetical protein